MPPTGVFVQCPNKSLKLMLVKAFIFIWFLCGVLCEHEASKQLGKSCVYLYEFYVKNKNLCLPILTPKETLRYDFTDTFGGRLAHYFWNMVSFFWHYWARELLSFTACLTYSILWLTVICTYASMSSLNLTIPKMMWK